MTDNSNRYGSEPLGKSDEEVEQESGTRVDSPVGGEAARRDDSVILPAVVNGTTAGVAALINPHGLIERDGDGTRDGSTTRQNSESSEE